MLLSDPETLFYMAIFPPPLHDSHCMTTTWLLRHRTTLTSLVNLEGRLSRQLYKSIKQSKWQDGMFIANWKFPGSSSNQLVSLSFQIEQN